MNWTRIALAGIAAGVVTNVCKFIVHGLLLADTYTRLPDVFEQEPANPLHFFLISIGMAFAVALVYAKTKACLPDGVKGGVVLGFSLGLLLYFNDFYYPLVIDGFPYYLAWCWGTTNILCGVIAGAIVALVYKE